MWRNGSIAVTPPPAAVVGSVDCIAGAETHHADPANILPGAGVDVRCYPPGQVPVAPVPPPDILFWLRGRSISPPSSGSLLPVWHDSGPLGNDVSQGDPSLQPFAVPSGGPLGTVVRFGQGRSMSFRFPPELGRTWSVYLVLRPGVTSIPNLFGIVLQPQAPTYPAMVRVVSNAWLWSDGVNGFTDGQINVSGKDYLCWVRVGTDIFDMGLTGTDAVSVDFGSGAAAVCGGVGASGLQGGSVVTDPTAAEILAYRRRLSDSEHAAVLNLFATLYGV